MKKKKIIFNNNSLRGLLNFRDEVIKHYLSIGYHVVMIAPDDGENLVELPVGVKYIPITLSRSGKSLKNDFIYWNTLRKIYKEEKPDYIFHYTIKPNIYGTLAAFWCGIRSSAMIAGLGHIYSHGGLKNRFARCLYKFALKFADYILVLNDMNRGFLISRKIVKASKIIFLPGGEGINVSLFQSREKFKKKDNIIFLMIARLIFDKGYKEYVEAACKVKKAIENVEFRLLGSFDFSYPEHVSRERVQEDHKKGYITYLGYSKDVKSQIEDVDCIVLPSFYNEGLSRVLMEALAMGKPIITTDIPGCREAVESGKNGYIVFPRDSENLAEAMIAFAKISGKERRRMGEESRVRAEAFFDVKEVVKVYQEITDEII